MTLQEPPILQSCQVCAQSACKQPWLNCLREMYAVRVSKGTNTPRLWTLPLPLLAAAASPVQCSWAVFVWRVGLSACLVSEAAMCFVFCVSCTDRR